MNCFHYRLKILALALSLSHPPIPSPHPHTEASAPSRDSIRCRNRYIFCFLLLGLSRLISGLNVVKATEVDLSYDTQKTLVGVRLICMDSAAVCPRVDHTPSTRHVSTAAASFHSLSADVVSGGGCRLAVVSTPHHQHCLLPPYLPTCGASVLILMRSEPTHRSLHSGIHIETCADQA